MFAKLIIYGGWTKYHAKDINVVKMSSIPETVVRMIYVDSYSQSDKYDLYKKLYWSALEEPVCGNYFLRPGNEGKRYVYMNTIECLFLFLAVKDSHFEKYVRDPENL